MAKSITKRTLMGYKSRTVNAHCFKDLINMLENKPKQFIDFFGVGATQLQLTYKRFLKIVPKENIFVCTNKNYEDLVREQLPDLSDNRLLVEPVQRNTAPSVAWAHARIRKINSEARVVVDTVMVKAKEYTVNSD